MRQFSKTSKFVAKPDVFHPKYGGKFSIYGGEPIIPIFNVNGDWFDYIKENHAVSSNDIVVASNQKNGTHWTKRILLEIMKHSSSHKNVERYNSIDLTKEMPCIEATDVFFTDDWSTDPNEDLMYKNWLNKTNDGHPRIYHTHFHYHNFAEIKTISPHAKIINICRNPKDVAISLYLMNQNITTGGSESKSMMKDEDINQTETDTHHLEVTLYLFLSGLTTIGDHWDHILNWHLDKQCLLKDNNILYVYYEQLLKDPLNEIRKIAQYIYGCDREKDELNNDDYVSIVQKVLFKNMKQEYINNPGNLYERLSLFPEIFFRHGVSDNWKNYFSEEMSHFYDCKTRIKFSEIPQIPYYQQLNDQYGH